MIEVRPLADEDAEASRKMRHEAFGSKIPDSPAVVPRRGQHWLGAYDGGRLVARIADREYEAWFGGARLPISGMAGVTIASEDRATPGLLDDLVVTHLRAAKERGAVVSTMFPTAAGIYRRHGYERIAELQTVRLPLAALATVKRPAGIRLRRATAADAPVIRGLYEEWAATRNGPLVRSGVHFTSSDERLVGYYTAITLAEDDDGICGFASWDRSSGHTEDAYFSVGDLVWSRRGAAQALLAMLGTNAPVAGYVKLETTSEDPLRLVLPSNSWQVTDADVYGCKVLDVAAAFEGRTWDPSLRCALPFRLVDDVLAENEGGWLLEVADGEARVTRHDADDALVLTSRGLAVAYAGTFGVPELRTLGLADGDASRDAAWAVALGGRRPGIRDYF